MNDKEIKNSLIKKSILMYILYFAIISLVQYIAFGMEGFTTRLCVSWIVFLLFGIWRSVNWVNTSMRKIKEEQEEEN